MSRSTELQAQLLILQGLGHTVSQWFVAGRGSRSGVRATAVQDSSLGKGWSTRCGKRKSWKNITRADLMRVATRGGKDKDKRNRIANRVNLAWRWLKTAKAAGKTQVVPQLDKLMRMIPNPSDANNESLLTAADLREMFVARNQFLTLDTGLYIAQSTIKGAGNGLFYECAHPQGCQCYLLRWCGDHHERKGRTKALGKTGLVHRSRTQLR